jgi:hypothetical protein
MGCGVWGVGCAVRGPSARAGHRKKKICGERYAYASVQRVV